MFGESIHETIFLLTRTSRPPKTIFAYEKRESEITMWVNIKLQEQTCLIDSLNYKTI